MTEQRQPPYSEDAERGVLGSIMLDARAYDNTTDYNLSPEAFFVPAHQYVFKAIQSLHGKREFLDVITVGEELKSAGALDRIGGIQFLENLIERTPTAAHSEYYIKIVADKWQLREIIRQSRETERLCFESDAANPDEIIASQSANFASIEGRHAVEEIPWSVTVQESMERVEAIMDAENRLAGFSTGLANIDIAVLGLKERELTILAARPAQGKTSLAMNIAQYVAEGKNVDTGRPVGIFSLEMGREELALRMKCAKGSVDNWQLMRGMLPTTELQKMSEVARQLSTLPLFVDDRGGLDIDQIRIKATRWKEKHDIQLLVIDYLQLIKCARVSKQGRQLEVSAISAELKQIAKELNIPVLALSQLSRKPEERKDGKPQVADLRESGSIEQDADNIWLMHRPCNYPGNKLFEDKTLAVVDVAKQRNGPIGECPLNFLKQFTRFDDRIEKEEQEETDTSEMDMF